MIESIYIIDQNSGIPLFTLDLIEVDKSERIDQNLFSGFLKAIDDLSEETRSERIDEIRLSSTRIVYVTGITSDMKLLYISISDLQDKLTKIKNVLHKVADAFEQQYRDEISAYKGNVRVFEPFSKDVREIINHEIGFSEEVISIKRRRNPIREFINKLEPVKKPLIQMKDWLGKQSKKIKGFAVKIITPDKELIIEEENEN